MRLATALVSSPRVFIRKACVSELSIAREIDDDACAMFDDYGIPLSASCDASHERAEQAQWLSSASRGWMWLAIDSDAGPIAFAVVGRIDERPHLVQLSVRRHFQRLGVGRLLLERALDWTDGAELWLTTYDHVPWNGPWYARQGFTPVTDSECGPQMQRLLLKERAILPDPTHRLAFVSGRNPFSTRS
jgi:GNAT superfamily N-acetyltransferase